MSLADKRRSAPTTRTSRADEGRPGDSHFFSRFVLDDHLDDGRRNYWQLQVKGGRQSMRRNDVPAGLTRPRAMRSRPAGVPTSGCCSTLSSKDLMQTERQAGVPELERADEDADLLPRHRRRRQAGRARRPSIWHFLF